MQLRPFVLAAIALVFDATYAAPPLSKPSIPAKYDRPSGVSTLCYTQKGTTTIRGNPWRGQTSWSTSYIPCATSTTVVSQVTVTPSVVTTTATTSTVTTITADTTTFVSTESTTITESSTVTSVETSTVTTSTVVTSETTSTSSAPAGWVPIQTSFPGSSYSGAYGLPPVKRDRLEQRQTKTGTSPNPRFRFEDLKVTQSVTCVVFLRAPSCKVVTVVQTSTTTASTSTSTTTVTNVLSSTIVPSATTTTTSVFTSTAMTTVTTTTQTTVTTTSTSVVTKSTSYAACNANNIADTYTGSGFWSVGPTKNAASWDGIDSITTANAYDCCVAALLSGKSVPVYVWSVTDKSCYLPTVSVCPATQVQASTSVDLYPGPAFVLGNGLCGQVDKLF